jgi:hypothetical protein
MAKAARSLAVALTLAAALGPGAARAAAPSFSAEVAITLLGQDAAELKAAAAAAGQPFDGTISARLFVSGLKMRLEMRSGPQRGVVVSDGAVRKTWLLQPDQKSYLELDNADEGGEAGAADLARFLEKGGDVCKLNPGAFSCKAAGQATVGGRACQVVEVVEKEGEPAQTLCVDPKLHFPIRMTEPGSVTELTKVVEGPQPAALFTVPAGWTRLEAGR